MPDAVIFNPEESTTKAKPQEEEDTRITLHLPPSPIKLQVEEIS
jgi:hypothetical protein